MQNFLYKKNVNTNRYIIPVKLDNYEDAFNTLDYRTLDLRNLNDDLDALLQSVFFKLPKKLSNIDLELKIFLPFEIHSLEKEAATRKSIINFYKAFENYEKKIKYIALKRILYYIFIALILLSSWYFISDIKGNSLLTALLSSGGTVVLWQVMTLLLIENKNFSYKVKINKKLSNLDITFEYI